MDITLGVCVSDRREINKVIQSQETISGTLRNESGVLNPVILIEHNNPSAFNYLSIGDFNRHYFITEIEHVREKLWRIYAHVDVLYTYKNQIMSSNAIIDKSTNGYDDKYINDGMWISKVKTKTDVVSFPNGLSETGCFLLMAYGG